MKRKILSVTGIRSEYDIMSSVYRAIENRPELDLSLIVTGAHLAHEFGHTVDEIRRDGFKIAAEIESLIQTSHPSARLEGAARQLLGLSREISRLDPDMLVIFGDREETITTAVAGTYLDIPIAHISGGDRVIGNIDDHIRHAVTKLAHLHFATSEDSKNRILKMGEQPFRVFNSGNPGLDRLKDVPSLKREDLLKWYGFDPATTDKPLLLVIQHVISSEYEHAYEQMKTTMEVIKDLGFNTVISYPNSDTGSSDIIACIGEYLHLPFIKAHKNIPRLEFVNTMRQASCMIGNSSAGLLEAPFLKLPVVNVGNRQKARIHAENVQFVPHDQAQLKSAVLKACTDETYRQQVKQCACPFGDGHASEKIAKVLAEIPINDELLLKDITI